MCHWPFVAEKIIFNFLRLWLACKCYEEILPTIVAYIAIGIVLPLTHVSRPSVKLDGRLQICPRLSDGTTLFTETLR